MIPGHQLSNWPGLLAKEWPEIKLFGEGKKVSMVPYSLKDSDDQTVLSSFVIYREKGEVEEGKPLLNVDLLYITLYC